MIWGELLLKARNSVICYTFELYFVRTKKIKYLLGNGYIIILISNWMHLKLEERKEKIKPNIRYVKEGMKLPNQLINVLWTDLEKDKLNAFGFYMCVRFALRLLKIRKKIPYIHRPIKI